MQLTFDEVIDLLKEYQKEHGDLLIPVKYCTIRGVKLGAIVHSIRSGKRKITVEEKGKLDGLGFVWKVNPKISFDEVMKLLEEYKRVHGNLYVHEKYCTANGIKLGSIVHSIRCGKRKTTEDEKAKLDELGFTWKCILSMNEIIELLEEYKKVHDNLRIPLNYCTTDGIKLGQIVRTIRAGNRQITVEEKAKLDALGFIWKYTHSFDEVIELLKEYKREYGDLLIPVKYCNADGVKLGQIVHNIRRGAIKITAREKEKLDELGFVWKVR